MNKINNTDKACTNLKKKFCGFPISIIVAMNKFILHIMNESTEYIPDM